MEESLNNVVFWLPTYAISVLIIAGIWSSMVIAQEATWFLNYWFHLLPFLIKVLICFVLA